MITFNYEESIKRDLSCPEIRELIDQINEHQSTLEIFENANPAILESLFETCLHQSIESSNRMENIFTIDYRLNALLERNAAPKNRLEKEIVGYSEALRTVHMHYMSFPITPHVMQQFHRTLFAKLPQSNGGLWKKNDRDIVSVDYDGNVDIRFTPVAAEEVASSVRNLCYAIKDAQKESPLTVIPRFVVDFLCIHPFESGNGRVSRLLMLLMLFRNGYMIGKYASLTAQNEATQIEYSEMLQQSSVGFHEGKNDALPFILYALRNLLKAYLEFEATVRNSIASEGTMPHQIKVMMNFRTREVTKKELKVLCPAMSEATIESALAKLVGDETLIKLSGGRFTRYMPSHLIVDSTTI